MPDLHQLAKQALSNAATWEAIGPPRVAASIEVCQRHAELWDALHTLALSAGAWVEQLAATKAPDGLVLRSEEEAVAAVRRLSEHLTAPPTTTEESAR